MSIDKIERLVVIGDPHCGAHSGLYPPELVPSEHPVVAAKYLNYCWDDMLQKLEDRFRVRKARQVVAFNGDLIDGKNRRGGYQGVFTTSYTEQAKAAARMCRQVVEFADVVVRTKGTPYHEGYDGALELLDEKLGIGGDAGPPARDYLNFKLDTGVVNLAHHPPGGAVLYQGTKVDRLLMDHLIAEAQGKVAKAHWIIRSHLHTGCSFFKWGRYVMLVPCWKLAGPYEYKGGAEKWQPDIGFLELVRDERNPTGYTPYTHVYPLPESTQANEVLEV